MGVHISIEVQSLLYAHITEKTVIQLLTVTAPKVLTKHCLQMQDVVQNIQMNKMI